MASIAMAESRDSVRKPCAMVPPNGVSAARSGSTWMNCQSSVMSANALIFSWLTSSQSETPISLPDHRLHLGDGNRAAIVHRVSPFRGTAQPFHAR